MQSKLPVRLKKNKTLVDKKKCCCAQLLKTLLDNEIDPDCVYGTQIASLTEKATANKKRFKSNSTQTKSCEFCNEPDITVCLEIKKLLESINSTLGHILLILQDKKEYLYNKLQEDAANKKLNIYYNKNKVEKTKRNLQFNKKFTYTWPEISRLYYGQLPCMKHYMQKFALHLPTANSNIIIYPKRNSWISARPLSCSDINYFQPMEQMFERKSIGISIYPNRVFTLIGQGDLYNNSFDCLRKRKRKKDACKPKNDTEIQ